MKDKEGTEIIKGCRICYAVRQGNSAALKLGRVREVFEDRIVIRGDENTRDSVLTISNRILLLPN